MASFNFTKRRGIVTTRIERIKREGSPQYSWTVPATAAGAASVIEVRQQFPLARKYEPLDWLEIVNNEAVNNLTIAINGTALVQVVPARTIRTIEGQPLWHISIINEGAVITTLGSITVTIQRQPLTTDRMMRGDI